MNIEVTVVHTSWASAASSQVTLTKNPGRFGSVGPHRQNRSHFDGFL